MHRELEIGKSLHRHYSVEVEVALGVFLPAFFSEVLWLLDKTTLIADLQADEAIKRISIRDIHDREAHDEIAGWSRGRETL